MGRVHGWASEYMQTFEYLHYVILIFYNTTKQVCEITLKIADLNSNESV